MNAADRQKGCGRCGKYARMESTDYCSRCLCEVIERRVSRKLGTPSNSRGRSGTGKIVIACDGKNSLSCKTAAYIAKKLCRTATISVIAQAKLRKNRESARRIKGGRAIIMPKCADAIAVNFMERITANDGRNKSPDSAGFPLQQKHSAGAINIFGSITEKELELYAAIKRIKYLKGKSTDLRQKIQKLQSRYPGTIEALAQSSRCIGEI